MHGTTTELSPLLTGISRARRPTGPLLALVVVVLCLMLGQTIGVVVFGGLIGVAPELLLDDKLGLAEQMLFTLTFLGALALLLAWVYGKERRSLSSLGFRRTHSGGGLVLGSLLALLLVSIPVLVGLLVGQYEPGAFEAARTGGVLVALVGFAVQGSTEEILVRGYLMQALHRKWGLVAAVVLQGVVFAALHGVNAGIGPVAVINLVLISLLFAFWALAEGGLWGVCAFHAVWNWCQGNVWGVAVSGLDVQTTWTDVNPSPGSDPLLTGGVFGVEGSLVTTAVLAVGATLAMLVHRRATFIRNRTGVATVPVN